MRSRFLSVSLFFILVASLVACTEEDPVSGSGDADTNIGLRDTPRPDALDDTADDDTDSGGDTAEGDVAGDAPLMENCTNGVDDDGDTLIDCGDPDCDFEEVCAEVPDSETACADMVDEDRDGRVDCDDSDCFSSPVCLEVPDGGGDSGGGAEICDDGVDNDGDGLRDCYDDDCSAEEVCLPEGAENCTNLVDDDGDGLVDCDDDDCTSTSACGGTEDPICAMLCPISPEIALLMGCLCS